MGHVKWLKGLLMSLDFLGACKTTNLVLLLETFSFSNFWPLSTSDSLSSFLNGSFYEESFLDISLSTRLINIGVPWGLVLSILSSHSIPSLVILANLTASITI